MFHKVLQWTAINMKPFGIITLILESKTYAVGSCKLMLCFNILQ